LNKAAKDDSIYIETDEGKMFGRYKKKKRRRGTVLYTIIIAVLLCAEFLITPLMFLFNGITFKGM